MSRKPDPSSIILGVFDGDEVEEESNEDVEGIPVMVLAHTNGNITSSVKEKMLNPLFSLIERHYPLPTVGLQFNLMSEVETHVDSVMECMRQKENVTQQILLKKHHKK